MFLQEVNESQKAEYNNFVAASQSGSFLQSFEWGRWQENLGRQVYRYNIMGESGYQIGSAQFIKMPLVGKKYYFYAPYGPVFSGEKLDSRNWNELLGQLKNKIQGAVFVRLEPKNYVEGLESHGKKTTNIQPAKTLIIDLKKTEEELLAGMHPKTRYNIKVAQKHGVEIKDEFDISIGHGLFAKEAVELVVQTAQRQGFKGYGTSHYNKMIDSLAVQNRGSLKLHIYKAIFNNRLLASAIMLDFGNMRTFLFGGSSDENKNVMAPYLLHWQAMLDAKAQGLSGYDFWGIETASGATPGFVRFKLGFGGEEKSYQGAYDIVMKPLFYNFYKLVRKVNRLFK